MDRYTLHIVCVVLGVACFVIAALSAFGVIGADVTGFALAGFAFWLGSTL